MVLLMCNHLKSEGGSTLDNLYRNTSKLSFMLIHLNIHRPECFVKFLVLHHGQIDVKFTKTLIMGRQ